MLIKKFTLALLGACFVLAGCNKYVAEADKHIETTLARAEELREMSEIPDIPVLTLEFGQYPFPAEHGLDIAVLLAVLLKAV